MAVVTIANSSGFDIFDMNYNHITLIQLVVGITTNLMLRTINMQSNPFYLKSHIFHFSHF